MSTLPWSAARWFAGHLLSPRILPASLLYPGKRDFVNVLMQSGAKRDPRLKDVPTIYELMDKYKTTAAGRSLAKVVLSAGEFGRPLVAPPGVPADRIKILRDAFDKSVNDPALMATAEKRRLEMDPAPASNYK